MTTATIVHFGVDECARLMVLQHSGYEVTACGTSIAKLRQSIEKLRPEAIAVSEDGAWVDVGVVTTARSCSHAPLILFEGVDRKCDPAEFDLVIPSTTRPADWLDKIKQTIEHSRKIIQESVLLRQESACLRQESVQARNEAVSERERSVRQRLRKQQFTPQGDPSRTSG